MQTALFNFYCLVILFGSLTIVVIGIIGIIRMEGIYFFGKDLVEDVRKLKERIKESSNDKSE
ncbi:MAG: hypothetical protein IJJ01_07545 [Firmicutes bacterium]|nr:hypothetical protein [Bacillota bacterium]